jgi:hypothetical protein
LERAEFRNFFLRVAIMGIFWPGWRGIVGTIPSVEADFLFRKFGWLPQGF